MNGYVTVLKSGLQTTIQDLGRIGYSRYGVPRSGVMDQKSYLLANSLLGNNENDAVIEWTLVPPVLQFSEPTLICLTGAETKSFLNGKSISMFRVIQVKENDILEFNICKKNLYVYIGIKNGFQSEIVLKSRSFFKSITTVFLLKKRDVIKYVKRDVNFSPFSTVSVSNYWMNMDVIKVYRGPEYDQLSEMQKNKLMNSMFTLSATRNRMAIQIEELLLNELPSMLTSPVLPGTIQLTPSGKLIILMRDCQTTGGYPRVLLLSNDSINIVAQKLIGKKISFQF